MMRLTKTADYGLIALAYLARKEPGCLASARTIADHYHIPYRLLSKILQSLAHRHLVEAVQGSKGGYRLARAPECISVYEVIEAVEGVPVELVSCGFDHGERCEQFAMCDIRDPLQVLNTRMKELFDSMSITDVAH